jgi:hypothetical protein
MEIAARYGFYVVGSGHHGYIGSVQRLWRYISTRVRADFVFLAEDDFLYVKNVDLPAMMRVLAGNRSLRQIALLREAAYAREREPGDHILSWNRDSFTMMSNNRGDDWMEHRNFWTMNPSLIRRDVIVNNPWPTQANSERLFGDRVLAEKSARVAFWGAGDAWLRHIGETRAGGPY